MSTENKSKSEKAKRIAINAGKGLATLVFPPAIASFFKDLESTVYAGGLAILGSLVTNGVINGITKNNLYDTPQVSVISRPNNYLRGIPEILTSPLLSALDSHKETVLTISKNEQMNYRTDGDETLVFDSEAGRYALNFDENTRFDVGLMGKYFTLAEARNAFEEAIVNGNVLELRKADANYKKVYSDYVKTRKGFEDAVAKMNSELESLSSEKNLENEGETK